MTTLSVETKTCAVCGEISEHNIIMSTNAFGSADLDTRPPEMHRSTIDTWVQVCPSCGYCAPDISEHWPEAERIVESTVYQEQLDNLELPKLANYFLCWSLILENTEEYAKSGWSSVHAAWACDDGNFVEGAIFCRKRAVYLLQKAIERHQSFTDQLGAEEAILTDLLRRAGEFEDALRICKKGLNKNPEEVILNILRFQESIINKKDFACYTIKEGLEYKDNC